MAELGWEPSIDAAHVGVAANAGVVTLTGHVQSFAQKVAAERAAARVKGVKAVAEEIEVKLPHDIKRGDEDIAGAAIERLAWDSSVPSNAVEIKVEKGWVTLDGEVDWQFQKEAATQAIRTLIGVVGISNQIEIKPTVNATWNARDLAGMTAWSAPGATSVENDIAVHSEPPRWPGIPGRRVPSQRWCTAFAFQPWHSAVECKRYLVRFAHMVGGLNRLQVIIRTVLQSV